MRRTKKIVFTVIIALLVATAAAFAAPSPQLLKQGMSGDEIYKLQIKLLEFGYLEDTPDGTFGSQTKAAVQEFQLDVGLAADGVAGPATLKALRDYKPAAGQTSRARATAAKASNSSPSPNNSSACPTSGPAARRAASTAQASSLTSTAISASSCRGWPTASSKSALP